MKRFALGECMRLHERTPRQTDVKVEINVNTVNPQKRPAGLILALRVEMRVLLEFGHFCLLFFKFTAGLIRIRVLFEGGSLSRIYGICISKDFQQDNNNA